MEQNWLTKPETIRRLWLIFAAILAATVLAEFGVTQKPHFAVEGVFAFNALYGFIACAVLILVAKGIGIVLKRRDTYYEEDGRE